MTGAMYAAIAGLKTHMNKMNVIGNNIANVNTAGYKSQRTIFKDAMYSMYSNGSNGSNKNGGKNPSQIGYGSQVSSIDLDMHTGTYTLGKATDCMIYGDGFFMVGDKELAGTINPANPSSMKSLDLTRVGDFEFKADGYLCDGSGRPVYGFLSTGITLEGQPIMSDQLVPIRLPRIENGKIHYPAQNAQTGKLEDYKPEEAIPFAQLDSVSINKDTGAITGISKDTSELVTIGYLAIGNVTNPAGVTHTNGFYYQARDGAGDMQVSLLGGVAEKLNIKSVNGSLFDQMKNNPDSGVPADAVQSEKMLIGSAGGTNLMTGGLEGSNVDLASEISDMITTQRGYQANTRIITVTDTMLEELVNIKR